MLLTGQHIVTPNFCSAVFLLPMKYEKGNFITVPNKKSLQTLSATAQALFVWICNYADSDGVCFPSRATLAKNLNTSDRTVDAYLRELEDKNFIQKTNRFHKNEKISNEYQIMIIEGGSEKSSLPSEKSSPPVAKNLRIELKPIITKPTLGEPSSQDEIRIVPDTEGEEKPKKVKSSCYVVFDVFKDVLGRAPLNWHKNKTQRTCAENLFKERGLDQIRKALEFYRQSKDEPFCPVVDSPYDLDSKWTKLIAFRDK